MNWLASDAGMVGKLIIKDWQVYQKQLAAYVAAMLLALGLVGMGTPLMASAGALLLLVLLLVVGSYAIQSSTTTERKQQTAPFIMSLPVTPSPSVTTAITAARPMPSQREPSALARDGAWDV